jgi:acetylornithine deacetylase/succinyl-diaminopimelate desuccinylase-like protein
MDARRRAVPHARGLVERALSRAIHDVTGVTPQLSTTGGTFDGRFVSKTCPQVVEFGPVNDSIHKIDEPVWLPTSAGDDEVLLLGRDAITR